MTSSYSLGEVAEVQIGPFGSLLHKSDYIEGGVPVINPMHIAPPNILADPSFSVTFDKAGGLSRYFLRPGEVIMGRRGEMGRCAVVRPEQAGMICGTGSMKIVPQQGLLDPGYLVHILRTPKARTELENLASGVTMLNLNAKALATLKIPLPPLEEQKRIAGILDQAAELCRLRTRALDKLNTLGQAIFHEMFGAEAAPVIAKKSQLIRDFCEVSSGSTPSRANSAFFDGEIPWVKTGEVNGGLIADTEEKISQEAIIAARLKVYPPETVLIAMYGQGKTRGQVGILGRSAATNQACAALVAGEQIHPKFLFQQLLMSYDRLRDQGRGGNQPNLNAGMIKDFPIFVPDFPRQQQFVDKIQMQELLASQGSGSEQSLKKLFASLQHRAFLGEL